MKKILIITSKSEITTSWKEREQSIINFCTELAAQLDDTEVMYTTYQDLQFSVINGATKIIDTKNSMDLKTMTFVQFKNWMYELEDASVVAGYLNAHAIGFANEEVDSHLNLGKLAQMFTLATNDLPVPDTLYARQELLSKILSGNLPDGFRYPLIIKADDGSKGDHNYLAHNSEEALKALAENPDKQFVVQNFISNEGDYRILFIGLDREPLAFERKAAGGSHLNNTSKGGSGQFIDFNSLSKVVRSDARRSAEVLKREISGVDILFDSKSGAHYVLEVNSTPAIMTGYGQEEKLRAFADYIEGQIKEAEEE